MLLAALHLSDFLLYVLYICCSSRQRISGKTEPSSTLRSASGPRSVDMIDGSFTSSELLEYGPGGAL